MQQTSTHKEKLALTYKGKKDNTKCNQK